MYDTGNITQNGQQDVQPKMLSESYLKKNPQGREQYGDDDADYIHRDFLSERVAQVPNP